MQLKKTWRGLLGASLVSIVIAGAVIGAAPASHAAFPGGNGPVVFVNDTTHDIELLDPTTGVVTTICPSATCGTVVDGRPATTADGQTVAFANSAGIATVPITGGSFTQITSDKGVDPTFTPDGSTIVYEIPVAPHFSLVRVAATGGSSSTISGAEPGCVDEPEVSPNGATVAYINECASGQNLETIPIGGGLPNVVDSNLGSPFDQISWSPDGTRIAVNDTFHCPSTTPLGLVLSTANNGAPTCLPNSSSANFDPSFSPDGTKIVVEGPSDEAVVLNANGVGSTTFSAVTNFDENYWAPSVTSTGGSTTTTTTTPPPCFGTLNGSAFKGSNPKPKKALAGVIVAAGSASSTTNSAGAYSITVPCGTVTKTATGPETKTRVCHFGSKSGPTSVTVTVTNGSTDTENLFCKKK